MNLGRKRARTILCIFGIGLCITLITGVGLTTAKFITIIREMDTFYQGKVVVISKGSFFIQAIPIGSTVSETSTDELKQRIQGVKSVTPILMMIDIPELRTLSPQNISVGIPEGNWSIIIGLTPLLTGGRWPTYANSSIREVVIGSYLAEQGHLDIGSVIRIKNYELTVVGILFSPSALLSRVIIMPLRLAQEIYRYPKQVSLIVVEPEEGVSTDQISDRIELEFPNLKALTENERGEVVEPFFGQIEIWNRGISGMLFVIGLVLVSAVTLMNISERRKEVATLYAIGASKSFVIRGLLIETGLVGFFGGLLGLISGTALATLLFNTFGGIPLEYTIQHISEIVAPPILLEILTITVAIGLLGGLIPALISMRVNIVESLRSDQ